VSSRKIDFPPNFDDLPEDMQVLVSEECYMWRLKVSHGLGPDSPLLKSREKIK